MPNLDQSKRIFKAGEYVRVKDLQVGEYYGEDRSNAEFKVQVVPEHIGYSGKIVQLELPENIKSIGMSFGHKDYFIKGKEKQGGAYVWWHEDMLEPLGIENKKELVSMLLNRKIDQNTYEIILKSYSFPE